MAEPFPAESEPDRIRSLPRLMPSNWSRTWRGFPAAVSPLIGRERELATLCAMLIERQHRLITVVGPGGVGKTRLALAAAESADDTFPDGAAYIALAALDDPALLLPTIAQSLDVQDVPGRSLIDTLIAALQERRILLVLDNFEHLNSATAIADVSALLQGCSQLTMLVTSRAPLQLHHERRFATPPLALPADAERTPPQSLADFGAVALILLPQAYLVLTPASSGSEAVTDSAVISGGAGSHASGE